MNATGHRWYRPPTDAEWFRIKHGSTGGLPPAAGEGPPIMRMSVADGTDQSWKQERQYSATPRRMPIMRMSVADGTDQSWKHELYGDREYALRMRMSIADGSHYTFVQPIHPKEWTRYIHEALGTYSEQLYIHRQERRRGNR